MRVVYAVADVVIGRIVIRRGDHWPADDPLVLEHPGNFSDDPRTGLNFTRQPSEERVVEQMTAEPGERRVVRRG